MMNYLAPIIFKAMITFTPIANHSYYESATTTQARYEAIAEDIAEGAEKEPLFEGEEGAVKTGLLLASIGSFESAYRASVDKCLVGGDHGLSWTIFQLMMPYSPKKEICTDRKKAVEWAIKHIRESFHTCHSLPVLDRLSAYTTGHCVLNESKSRQRMKPAMDFLKAHKEEVDQVLRWGF